MSGKLYKFRSGIQGGMSKLHKSMGISGKLYKSRGCQNSSNLGAMPGKLYKSRGNDLYMYKNSTNLEGTYNVCMYVKTLQIQEACH